MGSTQSLSFSAWGEITAAFLNLAKPDLVTATRYVCALPYGRNSDPADPLIVLREKRGTCSTKHALMRRLAIEQGLNLSLFLGIYEMTDRNTPGVGPVLRRYGLTSLPEAHCYLRNGETRIDLTRRSEDPREPITIFLHEEEIAPTQIPHYKIGAHRNFLKKWIASKDGPTRPIARRGMENSRGMYCPIESINVRLAAHFGAKVLTLHQVASR